MYKKSIKKPGQRENCDICDRAFTVTAYDKAGPNGGLLCSTCGKLSAADSKGKGAKKPRNVNKTRRKVESNKMDRTVVVGAKSLQQLCIEKVAHNHTDVDDLGDLPDKMVQRLSEIFSKNRILPATDARPVSFVLIGTSSPFMMLPVSPCVTRLLRGLTDLFQTSNRQTSRKSSQ